CTVGPGVSPGLRAPGVPLERRARCGRSRALPPVGTLTPPRRSCEPARIGGAPEPVKSGGAPRREGLPPGEGRRRRVARDGTRGAAGRGAGRGAPRGEGRDEGRRGARGAAPAPQ